MTLQSNSQHGIKQLIDKYTRLFRISENLDYYAPEDFERAERQFVKLCLREGCFHFKERQET